jgi:hypothetical protein
VSARIQPRHRDETGSTRPAHPRSRDEGAGSGIARSFPSPTRSTSRESGKRRETLVRRARAGGAAAECRGPEPEGTGSTSAPCSARSRSRAPWSCGSLFHDSLTRHPSRAPEKALPDNSGLSEPARLCTMRGAAPRKSRLGYAGRGYPTDLMGADSTHPEAVRRNRPPTAR